MINKFISATCLVLTVTACYYYPLGWAMPATVLLLLGVVLWIVPEAWLFLVPALLPIGDLTPLTGQIPVNEFDMMVLTVGALGYAKIKKSDHALNFSRGGWWLILGVTALYGISVWKGVGLPWPFRALPVTHPYSGYISLWRIKGYTAVLLLIPLMRQALSRSENMRRFFIPGMLTGLGLVCFFAIWERQIFSGLFNFSTDYRITSTFFEMNTGGAFLDFYLSMCLPFCAACFFLYKNSFIRLMGIMLFCAGLYTLLVTFSRIGYASFPLSMTPLLLGTAVMQKKKWKPFVLILVFVGLTTAITLPVIKGKYIRDRFAGLSQSVDTRVRHWADAVRKMEQDNLTLLFGMGQGKYPISYYRTPDHTRPGIYEVAEENDNLFLRLYPGDSLYFGQTINPAPDTAYTLSFEARTNYPGSGLTFPICEKSMLHSFNCRWNTVKINSGGPNRERHEIEYKNLTIGQGRFYQERPVNFAIYNGSGKTVFEIDNLQLMDSRGNNLIKNGDFSHGTYFWFFATDNHLPWHIKNLWISQFFETGLLGLAGFCFLGLYIFASLANAVAGKDPLPLIFFSSFCGFFTVGLIDSPFDSNRILFFFYFLCFVSLLHSGRRAMSSGKSLFTV